MISQHYKNKRYQREKFIDKYLGGDGKVIDSFIINNLHPNGLERHDLTDNGVIIIYNVRTNKLVTKLIARSHQIIRYYHNCGKEPPLYLICLAKYHERCGYNHI